MIYRDSLFQFVFKKEKIGRDGSKRHKKI